MVDWLQSSLASGPDATPIVLAWRVGIALVMGGAVAGLYRWARRGEAIASTFLTTLVLLAAVIAMATQIIGDNVARAFSLVGALSVVRFRTVVKDTQDTAFVIFAVVVGMSAGANHLAVGLVGLAVAGLAAPALWPHGRGGAWHRADAALALRVGLDDGIRARVETVLATAANRFELASAATARKGSTLDLTYRVRLRAGTAPAALVAELNRLDGVETVDLSREA